MVSSYKDSQKGLQGLEKARLRQTHHTFVLFINKTGGSDFKAFNMASL